MKINLNDTITAISTPIGNGGIGIVRISGDESLLILKKIFKTNKNIEEIESHTINYGHIFDEEKLIDEVLVSIMKAPKTFTKEDVVEINCHGGIKSTSKVLETVIKNGARLADKGEFTKRGFLNGRIDLSQAEAIIDIINAKTDLAHDSALKRLEGNLSKSIKEYREDILLMIASIEASIDYPEHDMEHDNYFMVTEKSHILLEKIQLLLNNFDKGKILREGIKTVILGKPNVGKSSLLNNLIGEEKAIVTDIEGTTRDVITEYVNIMDIPLQIIDTAGIRETTDFIEKIGVDKSKEYAKNADLCFVVIDVNKKVTEEDIEILKLVENKKVIVLLNKIDLDEIVEIDEIVKYVKKENIIKISVRENIGIENLFERLKEIFFNGEINTNEDIYISNRHKECLIKCKNSLLKVIDGIEMFMPEDLLVIDLKDSYDSLMEITGESLDDDIIDKIFSEFCLGK